MNIVLAILCVGLLLLAFIILGKPIKKENFVENTKLYRKCIHTLRKCKRDTRHFLNNKVDNIKANTRRFIRKLNI